MALSKIDPNSFDVNSIGQYGGRRNLIINGAMQVAQRGTSASINNTEQFVIDRFNTQNNSAITTTTEQSSDAPDGFAYSYKLTFTTGAASSTSNYSITNYYFEKQDLFPTGHGTSSPKTVTLSFWVKSSVTGNHVLGLQSWAPSRRSNTHSYTINSANTWEYKTVSFTMDTTVVTVNNNAKAFGIRFGHAAGTDYEAATDSGGWVTADDFGFSGAAYPGETTNATWQITGLQLEVGDTATPFEHRSYGEELALCQRYYENTWGQYGSKSSSTQWQGPSYNFNTGTSWITAPVEFKVEKRANPSMTNYDNAGTQGKWTRSTWAVGSDDNQNGGFTVIRTHSAVAYSDGTANRAHLQGNWQADAEL